MRSNFRTDEDLLKLLHMRDHEGMTSTEMAERTGSTRNSVIGCLHRIDKETDQHFPACEAEGTLPPTWWKKRKART